MIIIKLFFSITVSVWTFDLQLRKDIFNSLFSKGLALIMVFNDSFIKISGISWRSVLLCRKPEYPEKTTYLPQVTDKL
jgi:hypothetical protein